MLELIHATMPGLDQKLIMQRDETHLLTGKNQPARKGARWNLYLQTADWRLLGSLQYPQQTTAELLPNYFPE